MTFDGIERTLQLVFKKHNNNWAVTSIGFDDYSERMKFKDFHCSVLSFEEDEEVYFDEKPMHVRRICQYLDAIA